MSAPDGDLYALQFRDGLAAGDFAADLQRCLLDAARKASEGEDGPKAWILEPFIHHSSGELCCVYVNARALDMAREAGLPIPKADAITPDDIPERRLMILG